MPTNNYGKLQGHQIVVEGVKPNIGLPTRSTLNEYAAAVETLSSTPLRIHATFPAADSKLQIESNQVKRYDGVGQSIPPVNSLIPAVVASWIDFQAQTTSLGVTFDLTWPASTVGQFRTLGLTLLPSGVIKGIWSPEVALLANLANPGTLFVKGGIPIGWATLECTDISGKFKTAGSLTDIIENSVGGTSRITLFGSGGSGGGSGSGDITSIESRLINKLNVSEYKYVTPVAFAKHEQTFTDAVNTTVPWNSVDSNYTFSNGQVWQSIGLLDQDFIAQVLQVGTVDVSFFLDSSVLATNTVFEISRDNGTNWQTLAPVRNGLTDEYIAENIDLTTASGSDLVVRVTSTGALNFILLGVGVFYHKIGNIVSSENLEEVVVLLGVNNTFTIPVTNFIPDNNTKVNVAESGLVYRYPAFTVSGTDLVFPDGTFSLLGQTYTLYIAP